MSDVLDFSKRATFYTRWEGTITRPAPGVRCMVWNGEGWQIGLVCSYAVCDGELVGMVQLRSGKVEPVAVDDIDFVD